jgi:cupin 2 domain-containing protein
MPNLFSNIPTSLSAELLETLIQSDSIRIERIMTLGQSSPKGFWYDQDEHEWVVVLQTIWLAIFYKS